MPGGFPKRARADALGKFELTDLPAGSYRLTASAEGFVSLQYGQARPPEPFRPIDLKDGEQFNKADFALPKTSAVEGRLVDEFGDPAPNVEVQVARVQYVAGKSRLLPASTPRATRPTDDQGNFRKDQVLGLHVMRREKGFGEAYGKNRTGEWEYVEYRADGSYITPPQKSSSCAECHVKAGRERDFVYRGRFPAEGKK